MSAPAAPPATSVAKTASQTAVLLLAGTAGAFNIYFDAGGAPDGGGMTNAALLAALQAPNAIVPPVAGATEYAAADLVTKLQEASPSGALYLSFHSGSAAGNGFLASALLTAIQAASPGVLPTAGVTAYTAADVVAKLQESSPTGKIWVQFKATGAGDSFTTAALLAALQAASPTVLPVPGTTVYSAADLQAKLQESSPSGALWVQFLDGSASGDGFTAASLEADVQPLYIETVQQVIVYRSAGARIYSDTTYQDSTTNVLDQNTILTVDQARISTSEGSWYTIKGGTYDGEFVRYEDVKLGLIV